MLEDEGLDALGLRGLASRLAVQAPALYWHISGKGELLGLMAGEIYREASDSIGASASWREWLLEFGRAFRRALLSHRDGARLCATAEPTLAPEKAADLVAAPLVAAGLDRAHALRFYASVASLALGWTLYQQNQRMGPYLKHMFDFDDAFEGSLVALVIGLEL